MRFGKIFCNSHIVIVTGYWSHLHGVSAQSLEPQNTQLEAASDTHVGPTDSSYCGWYTTLYTDTAECYVTPSTYNKHEIIDYSFGLYYK